MDISFNPEIQQLIFKPVYTNTMDIISIYTGKNYPEYTIDPSICTQEEMQQYFNLGLTHLFDIVDIINQ